jgi:hypothetical protein
MWISGGSEVEWKDLSSFCGGSPQLLRLLSTFPCPKTLPELLLLMGIFYEVEVLVYVE